MTAAQIVAVIGADDALRALLVDLTESLGNGMEIVQATTLVELEALTTHEQKVLPTFVLVKVPSDDSGAETLLRAMSFGPLADLPTVAVVDDPQRDLVQTCYRAGAAAVVRCRSSAAERARQFETIIRFWLRHIGGHGFEANRARRR
ncbi:MAG: hypothetical protein AAFX44_01115 [Pseudomonadota bacterium]